jgi:hypothetical protein
MSFVDILRKLGIFRSGSVSGTYKSGTERPTELMMDDVYDAKKDLINDDKQASSTEDDSK